MSKSVNSEEQIISNEKSKKETGDKIDEESEQSSDSENVKQVSESEEIRERISGKKDEVDRSAEKKKKPKMPLHIKILNVVHFFIIAVFIFFAIHFYFRYSKIKDDEFKLNEANIEIGRIILCSITAILFAVARAFLVNNFEN